MFPKHLKTESLKSIEISNEILFFSSPKWDKLHSTSFLWRRKERIKLNILRRKQNEKKEKSQPQMEVEWKGISSIFLFLIKKKVRCDIGMKVTRHLLQFARSLDEMSFFPTPFLHYSVLPNRSNYCSYYLLLFFSHFWKVAGVIYCEHLRIHCNQRVPNDNQMQTSKKF